MLVFLALAVAGFILILGGSLLGHDHDHDVGHDHDHGDHSHDVGHDSEPTVSIFSVKVIGTFIMGFGASGAIAYHYTKEYLVASLWGLVFGLFLGAIMYGILRLIYSQQANSLIKTDSLVGLTGTVTIPIAINAPGQVTVSVGERSESYIAMTTAGRSLPKGTKIRVVQVSGSTLQVE